MVKVSGRRRDAERWRFSWEKRTSAVLLITGFRRSQEHNKDRNIRWNGLMVLRTILYGPLGDEAIATAKQLLDMACSDPDPELRKRASLLAKEQSD